MLAFLSRHRYSLSLTVAAACWGIATVISKRALYQIPPLTLLPIQLTVSVGVLAGLVKAQRVRLDWSSEMRRLGALGVLNPGASYALSLVGLSFITASLSVLLWAIEPLMIVLLAWWFLGDRLTKRMLIASIVAMTGVVLVIFESGSRGRLSGIALTIAGVAACAIYTVISRKLIGSDSTLAVVMVQQTWALVFSIVLLGGSHLLGRSVTIGDVSAGAWASAVVSGVLYYAMAYWFYLTGLRHLPAGVAGSFINLVPVFGIAASHFLLDERLTGRQWVGAFVILIAVGAILMQVPDRRSRRTTKAQAR